MKTVKESTYSVNLTASQFRRHPLRQPRKANSGKVNSDFNSDDISLGKIMYQAKSNDILGYSQNRQTGIDKQYIQSYIYQMVR